MNGISERWEHNIVIASGFAARAHSGALRKNDKTPYIAHPARVAALVRVYGGSGAAISAAWLHDVIEDVPDGESIVSECLMSLNATNNEIAYVDNLIHALTKNVGMKPRALREQDMIRRVLEGGAVAVLVKMCDRIDNVMDFPNRTQTHGFGVLYMQESKDLLDAMRDVAMGAGYSELYSDLSAAISGMRVHIEERAKQG